jgi:hypothetical protein
MMRPVQVAPDVVEFKTRVELYSPFCDDQKLCVGIGNSGRGRPHRATQMTRGSVDHGWQGAEARPITFLDISVCVIVVFFVLKHVWTCCEDLLWETEIDSNTQKVWGILTAMMMMLMTEDKTETKSKIGPVGRMPL